MGKEGGNGGRQGLVKRGRVSKAIISNGKYLRNEEQCKRAIIQKTIGNMGRNWYQKIDPGKVTK